jgi:hypothetical protein
MKYLKIYEDYSDEELDDLLGDLASVGHGKKVKVACRVEGSTPQQFSHPSWWTEYLEVFAITVFPDRGTENANKEFALQKIRKGEFDQTLDTEDPRISKKAGPEVPAIVSKENIQKIASRVTTLYALLQEVKKEVVESIIKSWEEIHNKSLSSMSDSELREFYKTEWRSSPKKVKETINKSLDAGIRIREVA